MRDRFIFPDKVSLPWAHLLGSPSADIPGTKTIPLSSAKIGDIIAWAFAGNYGHTAIYAGTITIITARKTYRTSAAEGYGTIGAGKETVNYRTKQYLDAETGPGVDFGNPVMRRVRYK
jgi:hypothetical protein